MDGALTVIEFGDLSHRRRAQLWGDDPDPYDMAGDTLQWQPKRRHVGIQNGDGHLVASTGLVTTQVRAADGRTRDAVGLGGVIVAEAYRGRGLARRIVGEALRVSAGLGPELAMLFCLRSRAGLYQRLGFTEVEPPVLVAQPGGPVVVSLVVMWRTIHADAALPPAPVELLTLPF